MPTSILDAIKIQSRAIIPIAKALEKEIGKKRAHAIIGEAIAQSHVAYREKKGFEENSHPRTELEAGDAFPVEKTVIDDSDDSFGYNITRCGFAEYFRSIGEPEIGALMTCGVDFAAEDRIRPGWAFERTQTQMQGAPHCDFRWRKRAD